MFRSVCRGPLQALPKPAKPRGRGVFASRFSVTIVIRLVRPLFIHADIVGLGVSQFRQLRIQFLQLQARHFFVEMLGQCVDADRILPGIHEQLDLGDGLVGERGQWT